MTYTKIKFYIILILKKFPRMNNKIFTKVGPREPHSHFFTECVYQF